MSNRFDYIIAIDRSDAKLDVCTVLNDPEADPDIEQVENSPEALSGWLKQLEPLFPGLRAAVIFEQPAADLLAFFSSRDVALYPINPKILAKFREAFVSSRAKDDQLDCLMLSELLLSHSSKLSEYSPDGAECRRVAALVEARRKEVNRRVGHTNRLKSLLKKTFPQALKMLGEDLWRPCVMEFLRRWPTLQELRKADRSELVSLYNRNHCSRGDNVAKRLEVLERSVAVTDDEVLLDVSRINIRHCVEHIEVCVKAIDQFDREIRRAFARCEDAALYSSLPGAGETLAPRLYAAIGESRERFASATSLQRYSGVAPVTKQSGGKRHVHRRYNRPVFVMQSFVEYAKESVTRSAWAGAFWKYKKEKGMPYHCAMRELAFKWQRIIFRMWQRREAYDESRYIEQLKRKGSPICGYL